jgi:hypothetical protein
MCAFPKAELVHGRSRVKFAMNAGAQVLPPSCEYDSSKWWESGVISDHVPRTRIDKAAQFSLLRERRFLPFFVAQACGAFNDNLFKNVLVILVTYQATRWSTLRPELLANIDARLAKKFW